MIRWTRQTLSLLKTYLQWGALEWKKSPLHHDQGPRHLGRRIIYWTKLANQFDSTESRFASSAALVAGLHRAGGSADLI